MSLIEESYVSTSYRLHHCCHTAIGHWGHKQVDMIRHQDVRVDRTPMSRRGFRQATKVKTTIRVSVETQRAVVTALNYVQRNPG